MIIKIDYNSNTELGNNIWTLFDNVTAITKRYDEEEGCIELIAVIKGEDKCVTFKLVNDKAYICNDEGKTIDIIHPDISGYVKNKLNKEKHYGKNEQ